MHGNQRGSRESEMIRILYTNMTYQTRKSETMEQLMHHRSVRLWVSAMGFRKSVIYWGVKLFMASYLKTALLYFNCFTICSHLDSLNISADGVLKSACNIIRTARFWSLDILSKFDKEVVLHTTYP